MGMTYAERFKLMLDHWGPEYEGLPFDTERQVARRIIQDAGLGDPAQSIRLTPIDQIQMAYDILQETR